MDFFLWTTFYKDIFFYFLFATLSLLQWFKHCQLLAECCHCKSMTWYLMADFYIFLFLSSYRQMEFCGNTMAASFVNACLELKLTTMQAGHQSWENLSVAKANLQSTVTTTAAGYKKSTQPVFQSNKKKEALQMHCRNSAIWLQFMRLPRASQLAQSMHALYGGRAIQGLHGKSVPNDDTFAQSIVKFCYFLNDASLNILQFCNFS